MYADDFENYWVQSSKTVRTPVNAAVKIKTIDGVEPLDAQLGASDLKTVPDALFEPLFGQPSNFALQTYAILDAAKIPNLPELLETSGLGHRCLFKGDAYASLKDVAPWIVQIENGNTFVRNLFTRSDAQWHFWDQEPGIYVRSDASLDDLWRHFRKFTKVQDEQGKSFYFRFWDPATTQIYFTGVQSDATRINPFFTLPDQQRLHVIALTRNARAVCITGPDAEQQVPRSRMPVFDQSDRQLLDDVTYHVLKIEISDWLQMEYADRFRDFNAQPAADHIVDTGRRLDLTLKEEFAFLGQMMATSGAWFVDAQYPAPLCTLLQSDPATRLQDLVDHYATEQAKTPQAEIMEQWDAVQLHLAEIPTDDCVTPQQFQTFCKRFLKSTATDVALAIAETRKRLGALHVSNQRTEGQAMILTLIYGPRFFEDPFHPWGQLQVEAAIDAAWTMIVG